MKRLLRSDQTLFRDPDVFEFTFVPDHLHHRDAQVRELTFLLRPAFRGGSALSAVLRAPPGTTKTTTVRRIFREVAEETRQAVPVYVNCRHDHTPLGGMRQREVLPGDEPGLCLRDLASHPGGRARGDRRLEHHECPRREVPPDVPEPPRHP